MLKIMRKLPTILAAIFMLVQVNGLSAYAAKHLGATGWGVVFALALEAGVFGCSYWMRQSVTRKDDKRDWRDIWTRVAALLGLLIFLGVSGYLNTAKSLSDLPAGASQIDTISAVLFGLFPTLAAALLGILQGFVDRLPAPPPHKSDSGRMMRVYQIIDNVLTLIERRTSGQESGTDAPDAKAPLYECPHCHEKVKNLGSHVRWNCKGVKR